MRLTVKRYFLALCAAALLLGACAGTTPKDVTQTVYVAGWSLVGATNSVADLHDAGMLKGADYDNAKLLLAQATTAYQSARAAKSPTDAAGYIRLAQSLLTQLAGYLASKEGT